ncbi:hypothetical protein ABPG72_012982 [Tetrahymena utriculariae]
MNKLASSNKASFFDFLKFLNKNSLYDLASLRNFSQLSMKSTYFYGYCHSNHHSNYRSKQRQIPKYQFSIKKSNASHNFNQFEDQGIAANFSNDILRQTQCCSVPNVNSDGYNSGSSSNPNTSSKVQKDQKNQQQETLQKMQSSQEKNKIENQNSANKDNQLSNEEPQVSHIQHKNENMLNSSQSIGIKDETIQNPTNQQQQFGNQQPNEQTKLVKEVQQKFTFNDFCELTKFRLSVANTLVALPTYLYLVESVTFELIPLAIATQLMAMSSQTSNQIKEQEFDKQMKRTQRRPLPQKLISNRMAKILAASLYCASNAIFYSCFPLQTLFVANTIFFSYIQLYTRMKRISKFNTTIGAIVGSLTPYIGYTAAGGSIYDLYPAYYSIYMIFWQYQHFYGIYWIYENDYKKAGYKMCDNKQEVMFYMSTSFLMTLAANFALFCTNPVYPYLTSVYTATMAATYVFSFAKPAYKFYQDPNKQNAKALKNSSYIHLSILFLIITTDLCLRIYKNKCKVALENQQESQKHKKFEDKWVIGYIHKLIFENKTPSKNISKQNTQAIESTQLNNQNLKQ